MIDGKELGWYQVQIFMVDAEGKNVDTMVNVSYRKSNEEQNYKGPRGLDPTDRLNEVQGTDSDGIPDYKENNATHYFPEYTAIMTETE